MKISNLFSGIFQERPNRFTVLFKKGDEFKKAHLKDPGRLKELLIPGANLLLRPALNSAVRKTKYDVIAVLKDDKWVVINSGLHSDIAARLVESGKIKEFKGYFIEKKEYTYGGSRIDFLLSNKKENKMLVEVKGCTLVEDRLALFPDAPTTRGRKHAKELNQAKREGFNSAVLFLIMREDASEFSPNYQMDPDFSNALFDAYKNNVHIIAYSFKNIFKENFLEINPYKIIKINFKK